MKIDELKNLREKEIKEREAALKDEWATLGGIAISAIICTVLALLANGSLLGLFGLPAVVLVPVSIIGFFVMLYRANNFKK